MDANKKMLTWDFSDLLGGLEEYAKEFAPRVLEKAAGEIAMDGLGRMIDAAPIKTGMLRGSGSVHVNNQRAGAALSLMPGAVLGTPVLESLGSKPKDETVIVWGFNTHYAAKVHENSSSPKYVEKVLVDRMPKWMGLIAERLKAAKGRRKGK